MWYRRNVVYRHIEYNRAIAYVACLHGAAQVFAIKYCALSSPRKKANENGVFARFDQSVA